MNGTLKIFTLLVVLLVGEITSAPQGDVNAEYPNGAFDDRVPDNSNNQQFKEYADYLTRFDEWVTGKKVPIPADPSTDALHQELPVNAPNFGTGRVTRNSATFGGPTVDAVEGHAVFKREDKPKDALISADKNFGGDIQDTVPATQTSTDPAYADFIKELKRYDSSISGQEVTIPHNVTADNIWNSAEGKQH